MNCFQYLMNLNKVCQFMSVEKPAIKATNSELRRWFNNKSVEINFQPIGAEDPLPPFIKSLVLFPKSTKRRCTLVYDSEITLIQID